MEPSDRITAGVSFSRMAASVPTGRLVARHHRDEAGDAVGGEVDIRDVVNQLPPDEGEPHLRRPVELPVRHPEGEGRRDQPEPEPVLGDTPVQRRLHGLHLGRDAEVALAVAQVADDGPHRIVDLLDVLTQEVSGADPLHVAPGVEGDERPRAIVRFHGRPAYGSPARATAVRQAWTTARGLARVQGPA